MDEDNYYNDEDFDETVIYEVTEEEVERPKEKKKEYNILKELSGKKKKNMYFDEELVKHLIIDIYQPSLLYEEQNGKKVCISRENADKEVEKEIMGHLLLIANAIINKYSYWRFDSIDDLQSECLKAMYYYLPNYVQGKGTAFNLFSILCKRHLLNYTLKNQRHRLTADIDICPDIENREDLNYDIFFEDLEKTFINIIDRHYLREERKRYLELTAILMEYLDKNKKIIGKNDLASAFREYGYKSSEYKKFIEEMSKYKDEFYDLIR